MSADCLFCRIVAKEIPADVVAESERALAFRDIAPLAAVHVLVIPKSHHENAEIVALSAPGLLDEMVILAGKVAAAENIAESGYRLAFNIGPNAGQTVFHAHLHVLGGERLGPFGAVRVGYHAVHEHAGPEDR